MNAALQLRFIRSDKRTTTQGLDQIAQVCTEINGDNEVTPDEIGQLYLDISTGQLDINKTTETSKRLAEKYRLLTGKNIKLHI